MNPYIQTQIESIYEEVRSLERQADKMRELYRLHEELFKRIEPKARVVWITDCFAGDYLVSFNIYETGYDELVDMYAGEDRDKLAESRNNLLKLINQIGA